MSWSIAKAVLCLTPVAVAFALGTCHEVQAKEPRHALCKLPVQEWQHAIEGSRGPFNQRVMAAADAVIGEHIRANPDKFPGWLTEAPPPPKFFISDCYRWSKFIAQANYSGSIRFVGELLDDTSIGALRVAIHERMHQWQPRNLSVTDKKRVEYVVQGLERELANAVVARLRVATAGL